MKYASCSLFAKRCWTRNVSRAPLAGRSRPATFTVSLFGLGRCASDALGKANSATSARSATLVLVMGSLSSAGKPLGGAVLSRSAADGNLEELRLAQADALDKGLGRGRIEPVAGGGAKNGPT